MKIDLHTHSTASDGKLSATELIQRALAKGIDMLSITDHDTVAAYSEFDPQDLAGISIIPGIEFSSRWQKTGIHIVGLNIDLHSKAIQKGLEFQNQARRSRARRIAEKLEKLGIKDAWHEVQILAGESVIGRPHFARYLVEKGYCDSVSQAFSNYLGAGKTGDIKQFWAPYQQVVEWICQAGGTAVLAHPHKYKMTRSKLARLLDDFSSAGGEAMEVISGNQSKDITEQLAKLCQQKQLFASVGSDFHQPGQSWSELGNFPALPGKCTPVWEQWN